MSKKQTKIAIIGSRNYKRLDLVEKYVQNNMKYGDLLVSGGAKGVDLASERAADKQNVETKIFLPDWEKNGKGAGLIRNTDIVKNSDKIVAFWDGKSRGTLDSIKKAKKMNKEYEIYGPNGEKLR